MPTSAGTSAPRGRRAALAGWVVSHQLVLAVSAAFLAIYLATRIYFAVEFPYFVDEGTYGDFVERAAARSDQIFASLTIGREPLQIWLSVPFVKFAGVNPLDSLRYVSIGAGLASVLVVGLLGRQVAGTAVGLVAAGLCVVSPFFLVHNGIGIMESLVTLVMAAALAVQIALARRPDLWLGVLLGVVLAAAVLTKENTKPALVLLPLSLLLFDWSEEGRRERLRTWLGAVAIAALMTLAAYLSMRLSHFWSDLQVARSSAFYTVRDFGDLLEDPFWSAERAWPAYRPALTSYITLPVLAAAIAGAVLLVRRNRRLAVLLLIWIALPTVISFSFTILPFPRHIMYLMPPIIVLAALGIVEAARWCTRALGPPRAAVALTVAGALFLAPSLVWDGRVLADPVAVDYPGLDEWQYVTGTGGGAPWPYLERDMRRRAGEEQVIVITPSTDGNVIRLMLHEDPRFVFVKGTDPRAQTADFAVTDENALPDFEALEILREGPYDRVGRYQRPNGGKVVKLYERNPRL